MGKQYTSVGQMVNDLADESFAKAFAERSAKTGLSRTLFVLRNKAGLTEREVGDRLGWSQSAVSKFERQEIDNIKFGDIGRYLNALDMDTQMSISFFEKGNTVVDQVKRHVFETKHLLDRLATMVGEDEKIAREVAKFFAEYFVNVNNLYFLSASQLPRPEVAFDLTMKFFDEYLEKVLPIFAEAEVADGEGAEDAPPKAFRNISLITS